MSAIAKLETAIGLLCVLVGITATALADPEAHAVASPRSAQVCYLVDADR